MCSQNLQLFFFLHIPSETWVVFKLDSMFGCLLCFLLRKSLWCQLGLLFFRYCFYILCSAVSLDDPFLYVQHLNLSGFFFSFNYFCVFRAWYAVVLSINKKLMEIPRVVSAVCSPCTSSYTATPVLRLWRLLLHERILGSSVFYRGASQGCFIKCACWIGSSSIYSFCCLLFAACSWFFI